MAGLLTTRREVITSSLGLAGIIAAGKAPAAFVRSMVAARGVACGGDLPYDTEVQWIGTDGTGPWINSEIIADSDLAVDFECMVFTYVNAACCGVIAGTTPYYDRHHYTPFPDIQNKKPTYCYSIIDDAKSFISAIVSDINIWVRNIVDVYSFTLYQNANGFGASSPINQVSFNTGLPYGILGRPTLSLSSIQSRPCRFKYFKMSKHHQTLRDFIPVRVGSTGYMYDRVTGKLFGNAGTGAFIVGPDK